MGSDSERYAGYSYEELENAWNGVRPVDDWKAPVRVRLDDALAQEVDKLSAAIMFYTATEAEVVEEGGFRFLVADGYRAGPAGP